MHKLKRVELLGFKSFADRTRLDFADGIAAVVGPNGCGKSNLSDAISWVLGEQSAKSLRGERMADVIFNGTSARPATGMAEVSLTLIDPEYVQAGPAAEDDSQKENPLAEPEEVQDAAGDTAVSGGNGTGHAGHKAVRKHRAGEIVVTRRLFRSGESEYLINGELCRLRDIQDLFMGTGLGPDSYAIIEQGRIGQILSSKPSDRRAIIEEAAGVSKFKTRKRLAEAKLETSRQNLARITDILEEVTKQVNSLKRQASKARRFREMQEDLRGRLKVALTSRLMTLETDCRRLRDELATLQAECAEATQQLDLIDREQKGAASRHDELEDQLTGLRTSMAQADLERERLSARMEFVRQQTASLEARSGEAETERQTLAAQLAAADQEAAENARQAEQLQRDLPAAQETGRQLLARQEDLSAKLAQAEVILESSRAELLAAVSELAELRNQLVQAEENGLALDRQAVRARADVDAVEQEHARLAAEFENSVANLQHEQKTLSGLAESVSGIASVLEHARSEEATQRAEVEALRLEFSNAQARKQALEESLARHAYSTESVRRLLAHRGSDNGHGFRTLGVLADFVEVAPGYEDVVEEFLKNELDCVVVERHEEARSGISLLKSEGTGRSMFFVTQVPSNGPSNGHDNGEIHGAPGVLACVRELVRFEPRLGLNGGLPFPALVNAYIVEDGATAERLAAVYPDCHFLTASGEHYHHRLVSGGKGRSAGPLALRRDFRELERRVSELESQLKTRESVLGEATARIARLDQKLRWLTEVKLEAEKKAVVADQKLLQTREAYDRASERLHVLKKESAAFESEQQANRERQGALRARLEAAGAERQKREERVAGVVSEVRALRSELDGLSPALVDAQAHARTLEERALALETEGSKLAARRADIQSRVEHLQVQCQSRSAESQRLAEELTALASHLSELEAGQTSARETLQSIEQETQAVRARRDELVSTIDTARGELDSLREKRSEAEVALARADSDHAHHIEQSRQKLHADPMTLLAELPGDQALVGEALLAAEEQARELESRIENLGPVNMMALEELQEAEDRYTFLETQRQDLLASIEDTSQAIREIDLVSQQQFLEAFKSINAFFAESFRTLFGGGIGEMRLSDDTDADSGIDIVAQPPGKRLQNVLLLSGGEKALAALALLIAMFRYTPSPFCILDEVDAPLDESNVDRFTRMIDLMSRHTQFILITHNKRTMEIAEVMYGVTMEEPGISKLVSVRFDALEREVDEVSVPA